ncbi:unnamed protein product [Pedinophyceae sp. YPF-701]|nr:unnamed protein product [Pedinophyceae sp. YPF-701]
MAESTFPVVSIAYREEDAAALRDMRMAMEKQDLSEAALGVTERAIDANAADYTAWAWRWRCLEALRSDLDQELEWLEPNMLSNPKNYQMWNHRRRVAGALCAADGPAVLGPRVAAELAFVEEALRDDAKNYHAWAHRQHFVGAVLAGADGAAAAQEEAEFTDRLIERDARNNSAWNHRMYVLRASMGAATSEADATNVVRRELAYAWRRIHPVGHYNESAWAYARGLGTLPGATLVALSPVVGMAKRVLDDSPGCPPALAALGEYCEAVCRAGLAEAAAGGGEGVFQASAESGAAALRAYASLQGSDGVHAAYWRTRADALADHMGGGGAAR